MESAGKPSAPTGGQQGGAKGLSDIETLKTQIDWLTRKVTNFEEKLKDHEETLKGHADELKDHAEKLKLAGQTNANLLSVSDDIRKLHGSFLRSEVKKTHCTKLASVVIIRDAESFFDFLQAHEVPLPSDKEQRLIKYLISKVRILCL